MPINEKLIEQFILLEKSEQYTKTAIELLKLKTIDKATEVLSRSITWLMILIVFCIFLVNITIAISLWLGNLTGKNYFGFLIVAFAIGLAAIVLIILFAKIKKTINNSIITEIFKN